jgi:SAM-dependent methyltransferase
VGHDDEVSSPGPSSRADPYYREDLALVHHRGFGFHADACAPGILRLLGPVLERRGSVVEIGCGSGLLTRHLVEAGHDVVATDASPAMLELARQWAPGAAEFHTVVLPDDPLPTADAVVGVGHCLNYLPDAAAVHRALRVLAGALRPGGILAFDLCDLEYGTARRGAPALGRVGDDWAVVSRFATPAPDSFVRMMSTFVRNQDGSWRRDDERHDNVLVDVAAVPGFLAGLGVEAEVWAGFGDEVLPVGLYAVVGRRR